MRRKARRGRRRPSRPRIVQLPEPMEGAAETLAILRQMIALAETGPALSAGDLDADWPRAHLAGDEAVGGSVATPDQDVVDAIAHALGVEQPDEREIRSSEEILRDRDRLRWHLEREAADEEEGGGAMPPRRRRRAV